MDVLSSTIFRQTLLDARGEEIVAVTRRMIRKLSHIFKPTHELESNGSPRGSHLMGRLSIISVAIGINCTPFQT